MMRSSRLTRILCVNCNICVNTLRKYRILDQNTKVCTLLCNWVHPKIITDEDYVCEACWEIAIASVDQNMQQDANEGEQTGLTPRGHKSVCLLCGCSLLQRRSDKIVKDRPTELQENMINIIQMKIEPQQLTPPDRVCHACWLRTKREALRVNRIDEMSPPKAMPENQIVMQDELQQNHQAKQTVKSIDSINLPNYKRAANTGNHCVFTECTNNGTLHSVSDQLRAIILSHHKYYLPKLARVCEDHLSQNSWASLYESESSINTFNAEQVQHIFSFVNAFNPT